MEKIQDFKPQYKYLENQRIEKPKSKRILDQILIGITLGATIAGMSFFVTNYNKREKLRKEVYNISDVNHDGRLENKEILTLVKRLEGISEESYLSLDAKDFVKKVDRTPNRVYEEFINKYGDEE